MATKSQFNKTEKAHQDKIFKVKGREPTNYGADVNDSDAHESWITSKLSDGKSLHTHHDHKTGKVTHTMSEESELDEAGLVSKATLKRYRDKSKKDFRAKGGINAALEKQDKEKKVEVRKENMDEGDGPHSVEFYDARERKAKAKWHYDRAGKQRGASLSKGIKHDFEAELLKRGVKDSNGNQTPLRKEEEQIDEIGFANKFAPLKKTTPNSGYMSIGGGKKGFNSSNPDMRINRRAGLDKDIGWDDDAPKSHAKQAAKMSKFKQKAALRKEDEDEFEQIDELDRKTLKSYQRKATTSRQRAWDKGDKEEDKTMSTDGTKYPEKQARHQANANVQHKIWNKREKGLGMVGKKLQTSKFKTSDVMRVIKHQLSKEGMDIVDLNMVHEEPNDAAPYIEAMEIRMNDIVAEFKEEIKKSLFNFAEGK